jgi:hypothetical protein
MMVKAALSVTDSPIASPVLEVALYGAVPMILM